VRAAPWLLPGRPAILAESDPSRFSNTALLIDRSGSVAGIYRKVHPVARREATSLRPHHPGEASPSLTAIRARGIQICFDMLYPDGGGARAPGAEVVALPSASPQTTYPSVTRWSIATMS